MRGGGGSYGTPCINEKLYKSISVCKRNKLLLSPLKPKLTCDGENSMIMFILNIILHIHIYHYRGLQG